MAYGVGDVNVLSGPRLDEVAADEKAHPRLRAGGVAVTLTEMTLTHIAIY